MEDKKIISLSKRLAKVLRHDPGSVGVTLDPAGWVPVDDLLAALARHGTRMDRALLERVVAENNKSRYAFDETGTRIRASQGHSVEVELGLPEASPPEVLYHGTVAAVLPAIRAEGLRPMRRHAVHLSAAYDTAVNVGARRGKPVVLSVQAGRMATDGHVFHLSANGVWLCAHVPPGYLDLP
ncbi:RNA 2'-phosphotransferase [Actinokineospora auranticolor]|uniref:Probable RNA 2'-phosphotransferase n=1 Tax=Actinokineospora auranticolor TaxID=155976 RepID=A0A2S6GQW5_9PSEU|nr:RNA 2'-phosphotransferase [Actinokineospora auranticolor]PPK67589.1 putative RNA 2'-phosphotransferase [Actinokineospora auranticolor]